MEKAFIEENFYQYQFPPRSTHPDEKCGTNIFVLIHDKTALVIDTGYEEHMLAVKQDILLSGIEPCKVIISHFHYDHILGLQALPGVMVFGSEQIPVDDHPFEEWNKFLPIQSLTETSVLKFGAFTLTFRMAPGHSPNSIYTIINNRYIHVADDLIAANDGSPMLPWAEFELVGDHIRSLEMLRVLQPEILLLGHGRMIFGKDTIQTEIENRLKYLQAVKDGNGDVSVEEATADCSCRFQCTHWHIRRR